MLFLQKTRDVKDPERGTPGSAGIDFFVPADHKQTRLLPGESVCIPSGIIAKIPKGYCMLAVNKSGISVKKHLSVGACLIDEDYQGEIHLHVFNHGPGATWIDPGEKLIQFILVPVPKFKFMMVDNAWGWETTDRGAGGFGSTNGTLKNTLFDKVFTKNDGVMVNINPHHITWVKGVYSHKNVNMHVVLVNGNKIELADHHVRHPENNE